MQQIKLKAELEEKNQRDTNTSKRSNCLSNVVINSTGGDGTYADYINSLKAKNDCYIKFPE